MSRISYDRNDNSRRRRQPRPRPEGNSYPRPGGQGQGHGPSHGHGHGSGRPAPQPPRRAARRPAGPARIEPVQPRSAKHRRQMAKAAAWRLAKLLHVRPADVLRSEDLQGLVLRAFPNTGPCSGRGPAARLAAKVRRLAAKA